MTSKETVSPNTSFDESNEVNVSETLDGIDVSEEIRKAFGPIEGPLDSLDRVKIGNIELQW